MCISDIIALLSALGTIAMAGFAFVSIRQNNKQLAELKRQWHEQNRPRLMPFFVSYHGRSTPQGYLRIKNISNVPAFGVSIEISSQDENVTNDSYIRYNELATAFQNTTFPLEPLGTKRVAERRVGDSLGY